MKKLACLLALLAFVLTACAGRTEFGECIGAGDEHDPGLIYRTSTWNVIMGVLFIETIIVPIVVVTSDLSCPVERRSVPAAPPAQRL